MHRPNHLLTLALTLITAQGIIALPTVNRCSSEQTVASKPKTLPRPKPFRREPSADALKWANNELRRMSVEEKIGQLISVGINATFLNQDSEEYATLKRQIEVNHIGGL